MAGTQTAHLLLAERSAAIGPTIEIFTEVARPDENARPATRLDVSRSHHVVTLYYGETAGKTYPVAVGRDGWETPLGQFHVFQMLRDPAWKHPLTGKVFEAGSQRNQLGHYWIGFWTDGEASIGFHGTPHPKTVGKPVSHGCLRMYEEDIAELFHQVEVGTLVRILP